MGFNPRWFHYLAFHDWFSYFTFLYSLSIYNKINFKYFKLFFLNLSFSMSRFEIRICRSLKVAFSWSTTYQAPCPCSIPGLGNSRFRWNGGSIRSGPWNSTVNGHFQLWQAFGCHWGPEMDKSCTPAYKIFLYAPRRGTVNIQSQVNLFLSWKLSAIFAHFWMSKYVRPIRSTLHIEILGWCH